MGRIKTGKSDVIWNYVGTFVSMASGFALLPFLMFFLSADELGLWYVCVAVSNFALLFEFGFSPTFARNIVYVISGARALERDGRLSANGTVDTDWHLLNVLLRAMRLVYTLIAVVALILLGTLGTWYICSVASSLDNYEVWVTWAIFCISVFLNLYFLTYITTLRGYGDIAGENKAKTLARLFKIVISIVLLAMGFGLIGAALGYLCEGLLLRIGSFCMIRRHVDIERARLVDDKALEQHELRKVLSSVSGIAWRDGFVQLALFVSTQAMTLMTSAFVSLAETGIFSIYLQLANAIFQFACAYPKSFYPSFQSAYAVSDAESEIRIVSQGIVAYWLLAFVACLGVSLVVLPLLPLFKQDIGVDVPLFLCMALYLALLNHHSLFCNYIVSMNQIPYAAGYIVASLMGIIFVYIACNYFGLGVWGILLGQATSQLVYNNWKWPFYLCKAIGCSYKVLLRRGFAIVFAKLFSKRNRL